MLHTTASSIVFCILPRIEHLTVRETVCIEGEVTLAEDGCNKCVCSKARLICTHKNCNRRGLEAGGPWKWSFGRGDCVEYQPLQPEDACSSCVCLYGRKVCTIIPCNDDIDLTSDEVILNRVRGGNRVNMKKKKQSFCVPFTFFSPDKNRFCRNCFCLHNGLALCLLNFCKYSKDIANQKDPDDLDVDEVCTPGEIGYPTKCVTCTCSKHGKWICTREQLALCNERNCDAKDEFHMGFFPYCAGCKCSVKEWYCSIKDKMCRDYSNVTCPLGTFIHNPMQHCSLCLCGGYEEGANNMCFTEAKCARQVIGH